jgi:hypothetical protein
MQWKGPTYTYMYVYLKSPQKSAIASLLFLHSVRVVHRKQCPVISFFALGSVQLTLREEQDV